MFEGYFRFVWNRISRLIRRRPRWDRYAFTDTPKSQREQGQLVAELQRFIATAGQRLTLLDVGCGAGRLKAALENSYSYTGLEFGPVSVIARGRLPSTAIVNGTIFALPFRTQSVDVVVAQGVLELLDDWRPALAELARVATRAVLFTSPAAGASSSYHHHIPAVGWVTIHTLARTDVLKWASAHLFTAHEIACGGRTLFVLQH